jgi:hypothetical protein
MIHGRWVEGALESAYEAVYKMLKGAGLEDLIDKLEDNWGNKAILKDEPDLAEKQSKFLREQEIVGAIFSTLGGHDEIRKALTAHDALASIA